MKKTAFIRSPLSGWLGGKFQLAMLRLEEDLNYADLIKRYDRPHSFFYIDPPYWGCENDYGKNIFERSDFEVLANLLQTLEGKFLLSLNDVPEIRDIFADFIIEPVTVMYTCSKKHVKAGELLIRNYEI